MFLPPLVAGLPFVYLNSAGVISISDTPIPYAAYAMSRIPSKAARICRPSLPNVAPFPIVWLSSNSCPVHASHREVDLEIATVARVRPAPAEVRPQPAERDRHRAAAVTVDRSDGSESLEVIKV